MIVWSEHVVVEWAGIAVVVVVSFIMIHRCPSVK